jgi:hypothetical protein
VCYYDMCYSSNDRERLSDRGETSGEAVPVAMLLSGLFDFNTFSFSLTGTGDALRLACGVLWGRIYGCG